MAPEEIDTYRAIVRRAANVAVRGDRPGRPAGAAPPRLRLHRAAASPRPARRRHGGRDRRGARACSAPSCRTISRARSRSISRAPSTPPPSVQDNVLFGRIVDTYAEAGDRVNALLRETMDALDLTGADHRARPRLRHRQRRQAAVAGAAAEAGAGARAGEAAGPPDRQPGARRARRERPGCDRDARARLSPAPKAGRASRYSGC